MEKIYDFSKKKEFEKFLLFFRKRKKLNNKHLNKIENLKFELVTKKKENFYRINFFCLKLEKNLKIEISKKKNLKKNFSAIFLLKLIYDFFKGIKNFRKNKFFFFNFEPKFIFFLENEENLLPDFIFNEEYFFEKKKKN